ncbi:probable arabinosyltransferase ARAD1 isoform X2 [Primulina huaijiensis]|uniref:probable arabinosyltransferase ARAD1 isoform X2 n=1 Tax=Primulina huaijiensis TaxID=1492673 RepID=UPI003CC774E4
MAGRHHSASTSASASGGIKSRRSPFLYFLISLFFLSLLFYIFTSSSSPSSTLSHDTVYVAPNPNADYSFVSSLQKFLANVKSSTAPDDTVSGNVTEQQVKIFDDLIALNEEKRLYGGENWFYPLSPPLKVYVYDMPSKFTYDLLRLFQSTYKDTTTVTSNGSPVHRLIEQEALKWVTEQPAWKRSEGRDHILPVHHPWSFKSVRKSMKNAIWLLPDMDSTGNWYKPGQVYLEKDVILPYVPNVDVCDSKCLSEAKRTTLLFFRGRLKRNAGGKIRAKLVTELTGANDVIIEEGTAGEGGKAAAQIGMQKSTFCLNPAGDTPSSARLFDAIVSGCIPVIVSDELELPFEGILDYRKIAVFVDSSDVMQPGWLLSFLRSIPRTQIREMQMNLAKHSKHFLYSHPALPMGPEDLVWRMIAGKLLNIKLYVRRSQRVVKGSRSLCTCDCRHPNITSSTIPFS